MYKRIEVVLPEKLLAIVEDIAKSRQKRVDDIITEALVKLIVEEYPEIAKKHSCLAAKSSMIKGLVICGV